MSLPAPAQLTAAARRRLVALFSALTLIVAGLLTPQLAAKASAADITHLTAAQTRMYAAKMLGSLNVERSWNREGALRMNNKLILSAHRHNLWMASRNTMSHQLPGEPFFATRISNAGYAWRSAGENIGWTSDLSLNGLYALERQMYNEKAPNNGHRLNILSRSFRDAGIDVYYDATHHKVWFTQDFGQPL